MGHQTKEEKHLDDAPPPYSPSGASPAPPPPQPASQQIPQQVVPQELQIKRQFPPAFSMYRESSWTQRSYMIGEHQSAPLYAVSLHSGWSGQPDIVLHNGPSDQNPPLAGATRSSFGTSATIALPPVPGSGMQAAEEKMEYSGGFGHTAYTFSIETGVGNAARREPFEWRHSSGSVIQGLGARGSGWKLVRLATGPPGGVVGASFVPGGARASDGKEVVAVWAWASGSLTKKLKFQFLGSGANGVLGERWAIMAVITALRIWDRERRQRNQSSAAAGGGGGA
ncbi:hypothetical protein M434DRAFT_397217 [Hypoxylon sp. CO27-5]|nr:hypothetical protein M434DRAFT_397217 [Hypoxylon sp. CO27-5]